MQILCYGDSNTYGYDPVSRQRHPKDKRWTGILKKMLGSEHEIMEQGCNGRTTIFPQPGEEWKSGLYALKVVLNTCKPIDLMIMMLGSNDLKEVYNVSAEEIAKGAEVLIQETREFMMKKTGTVPMIILASPIELGEGIMETHFNDEFNEESIQKSKELAFYYEQVAKRQNCLFFNAAEYASPSKEDCLHMMPDQHEKLAKAFYEVIKSIEK